jgi:hypothetical protein
MVVQCCGMLGLLGLILAWPGPWNAEEKDLVLDSPLRLSAWYFVMALNLARQG